MAIFHRFVAACGILRLMKKKYLYVSLFGMVVLTSSCGLLRETDAIRENEKLEAAAQKASDNEYQKAKKQHYKMQANTTQKEWKKTQRKSQKLMRKMHRKKSWFRNLFDAK
jgi:predicted tellurium resistance membrane protein TerC